MPRSRPAQPVISPWAGAGMVPEKSMDNIRDTVALTRCYLAGDKEGAESILTGTSDPHGCMTVLALINQALFLHLGADRATAEALLDDLARLLSDVALDLFLSATTTTPPRGEWCPDA